MMISSKIAEKIVSSGISVVSISLDSATEKYHDDFWRNSSGSWQKAVKGIKNSIDAGLKVQINTTLTENNFEQFEDVVNLAPILVWVLYIPSSLYQLEEEYILNKNLLKGINIFR